MVQESGMDKRLLDPQNALFPKTFVSIGDPSQHVNYFVALIHELTYC